MITNYLDRLQLVAPKAKSDKRGDAPKIRETIAFYLEPPDGRCTLSMKELTKVTSERVGRTIPLHMIGYHLTTLRAAYQAVEHHQLPAHQPSSFSDQLWRKLGELAGNGHSNGNGDTVPKRVRLQVSTARWTPDGHFPNYVDALQLLPDLRHAKAIRTVICEHLSPSGIPTVRREELPKVIFERTGRHIKLSGLDYHCNNLRYARSIIEEKTLPPKKPSIIPPMAWEKLKKIIAGEITVDPEALAVAAAPPAAPVAKQDFAHTTEALIDTVSRVGIDLVGAFELGVRKVAELIHRLDTLEHNVAVIVERLPTPQRLEPAKPLEVDRALTQPGGVASSFALENHLPRTMPKNGWTLYYSTGFERSLRSLPQHLKELLVKTIRRYTMGDERGIDYKRMPPGLQKKWGRAGCFLWQARVSSHYRLLINVDDDHRTAWIDKVVNRGAIPGYAEW